MTKWGDFLAPEQVTLLSRDAGAPHRLANYDFDQLSYSMKRAFWKLENMRISDNEKERRFMIAEAQERAESELDRLRA